MERRLGSSGGCSTRTYDRHTMSNEQGMSCARCGAANHPSRSFCRACGLAFTGEYEAPVAVARPAPPVPVPAVAPTTRAYPQRAVVRSGAGRTAPGYSGREAVRLSGATYRQLDYWCRTELLVPSICQAAGSGTARRYSATDVRTLRAIVMLLDAGLSLQRIRRSIDALAAIPEDREGFAVVTLDAVKVARTGDELAGLLAGQAVAHVVRLEVVAERVSA